MSRSRQRGRRGFALFLALLLLLVLTVSGIALMFNTSVEDTLSAAETKVSKTFYAADSGIEFASASLQGAANFVGGKDILKLSTNYPGATITEDISVSISKPVFLGYSIHPGDEFQSQGSGGSGQVVENVYAVTSTAVATSIQAQKTIAAEIGVYPAVLTIQ